MVRWIRNHSAANRLVAAVDASVRTIVLGDGTAISSHEDDRIDAKRDPFDAADHHRRDRDPRLISQEPGATGPRRVEDESPRSWLLSRRSDGSCCSATTLDGHAGVDIAGGNRHEPAFSRKPCRKERVPPQSLREKDAGFPLSAVVPETCLPGWVFSKLFPGRRGQGVALYLRQFTSQSIEL